MSSAMIRVLLSIAIRVLEALRNRYKAMTPEQKEEYRKMTVARTDYMGESDR